MIVALLAATLLAPFPPGEPPTTAGQLYDDCVRYVAWADADRRDGDAMGETCELNAAVTMAVNAAETVLREQAGSGSQSEKHIFCLPESVADDSDRQGRQLARAFIDYVDRNPASRSADAIDIFGRAAVEKWPCPH